MLRYLREEAREVYDFRSEVSAAEHSMLRYLREEVREVYDLSKRCLQQS